MGIWKLHKSAKPKAVDSGLTSWLQRYCPAFGFPTMPYFRRKLLLKYMAIILFKQSFLFCSITNPFLLWPSPAIRQFCSRRWRCLLRLQLWHCCRVWSLREDPQGVVGRARVGWHLFKIWSSFSENCCYMRSRCMPMFTVSRWLIINEIETAACLVVIVHGNVTWWHSLKPDITSAPAISRTLSDFRFIFSFISLFTYITINVHSRPARIELLNSIPKGQTERESVHQDWTGFFTWSFRQHTSRRICLAACKRKWTVDSIRALEKK